MSSNVQSKELDQSTQNPGLPERRVAWPPKLILQTPMGYLRDSSGNNLPRDIGRSSKFGDGTVIFQFGDTFCHSMNGTFTGLSPNNAAIQVGDNPAVSSYFFTHDSSGRRSGEAPVPPFLAFFPGEGDTETHFLKFWCFSGIVETHVEQKGSHFGVCYYETRELKRDAIDDGVYLYTGIASVTWNAKERFLEAKRWAGPQGPQFFLPDEPRFGAFCSVIGLDKKYIFLYGHAADNSKSVVLARVPPRRALFKKEYEYWNGNGWSSMMRECKPVVTAMQHGQIFQTDMFGRNSPFKYAFIGCNSFADSKARFGRAQEPQGPWEQIYEVEGLRTYAMQPYDPAPFMYCFYPHPWAFETKKNGDLMISWSEGGMNGSVIAELLRFETAN